MVKKRQWFINMTKEELAISNHNKKFNCAQAVACTFSNEIGVDESTLFRACEGFGLGMGCMDGTCGALTGAITLAGFKNSDGNMAHPSSKAATYKLSQELIIKFKEKTGSTICKEIKGIETGKVLRSCSDCIIGGVEVVEEVLGL